ncbi:MAG: hypothetical protein QM756_42735 [Polyangiaceae bacterium]
MGGVVGATSGGATSGGASPASTGGSFTATGGASGGTSSASTGGANTGGAQGGSTTAGASTGGTASSGGTSTGGTATGGTTTQGGTTARGGTASGGAATGGAAMGGAAMGGSAGAGGSVQLTPNITIDTQTRYQAVDGFGSALPMWGTASNMWTTDEVHKFVGMGDGELGTSIVRTIVDPDSSRWSYAVANLKEAKSYGSNVKILATPWSPPADMKDNNSTTNGGSLLPARYADYAQHLNSYLSYMAGQGVTIDVISVQNEPDWKTDYESCIWSGEQFRTFVRDQGASIKGAKLMIAESLGYNRAYTDPTLNDATAVNNIAYIGGHLYGAEASGRLSAYPLAEQKNKNRWMTEWNFHEADGTGAAIWGGDNKAVWDETLDTVMRTVHVSMDVKWNAYIWWWGRRFYSFIGDGDAAYGTTKGAILKRGWAFSHYAKFVRPGYTRVATKLNTSFSNLVLTAYEGDKKVVVVLLNRSTSDYKNVVFQIPSTVTSAQTFVTSQSTNRSAVTTTATGPYATVATLPARSIVTVVMAY